ncbi:MAG TPA: carboxypeptidase regulatory-like domain-containing protein, partial [Longimicrobiales bacterium]|nr:carboxypeptidase regulatory-like domain-containing protein [Longimicrobiales bacterium]
LRSRCARGVVGIVSDASGTPVIGVPVSSVVGAGTALTMTDASGAYALCDLPIADSVAIRLGQPANPMTTITVVMSDSVERRDIQSPQHQSGTARIVGLVRDIDSEEGIAAAAVRVDGDERTFLTDAAGRFVIPAVPAGSHAISVEALGYGDVSQTVAVGPGEQIRLEVTLGRDAIRLAALEVVARSARPGPLADFAERKELGEKLGIGVFLEREALRQRGAHVVDAVRGLPRVRLIPGRPGHYRIMFGRGITACEPHIYVDGILLTRPGFMDGPLEELIPYGPYEAVEIYRTPSELPAEFGGSDGRCGAIVIWMPRF